jgi:hypothetical protein
MSRFLSPNPQAKNPGPEGDQLSVALIAAAPQSKVVGSAPGGQSTKTTRFSFCFLMKPYATAFLINVRSASKNPRTFRTTTAMIVRDTKGSSVSESPWTEKYDIIRLLCIPSCVQVTTSMICATFNGDVTSTGRAWNVLWGSPPRTCRIRQEDRRTHKLGAPSPLCAHAWNSR